MTLTREDLQAIGQMIEDTFDRKFDEKFDKKFDEKFDKKFKENFDRSFDEKFKENFDRSFDEKFKENFDRSFDEKFKENFDRSFDGKFKENFGKGIKPIEERLKIIELKQDRTAKKLDDLRLDVKISERSIKKDIHKLQDEMETVIEILRQNEMIPQ